MLIPRKAVILPGFLPVTWGVTADLPLMLIRRLPIAGWLFPINSLVSLFFPFQVTAKDLDSCSFQLAQYNQTQQQLDLELRN